MIPRPYKIFLAGGYDNPQLPDAVALWQSLNADTICPLHMQYGQHGRATIGKEICRVEDCDGVQFLDGWEMDAISRIIFTIADEFGMDLFPPMHPMVDFASFKAINKATYKGDLDKVLRICQAIQKAFGVSFIDMIGERSLRNIYFGRMAFTHECRKFMMGEFIAQLLRTSKPNINRWINEYDAEIKRPGSKFADGMKVINGMLSAPGEG